MHDQRPDFAYVGVAREIGLDPTLETAPNSHLFIVPETTLGELAARVQHNIGARTMRVAGDPDARVSRIRIGVGYATPSLNAQDTDVVISGEQQETDGGFDSAAFAHDAAAAGLPRGWIMLGHSISEEGGMLDLAEWMKGFVAEVPIKLIRTGEPFWAPK
jgi:putative NIF3 family GTP cyclohydrolase 1 type 2